MTLAELRALALQKHGIYAAGETASSEDATFVDGVLTRALAQLASPSHDIAVWTIDDTPDAYAEAFVDFASPDFLPAFGMDMDPASREAVRAFALRRLRELVRDTRASAPGTAEYF